MSDAPDQNQVRIHKWLSSQGVCSRRDAEKMLVEGKIKINGVVVTQLGTKINPGVDVVEVEGKKVDSCAKEHCYFVLNKPVGFLTTVRDAHGRDTIFDLPPLKELSARVFPVGRLDRQTSGLLLLTNNGDLAQKVMHPSYSVPKVYHVRVREDIDPKHLKTKKVELEDGVLEIESIQKLDKSPYSKQSGNWVQVTIGVGRNRIVRRLVKHWGYSLLELLRAQLGSVKLDENSKPGDLYRLDSVQAEAIVK